jgi:hypothetical protein
MRVPRDVESAVVAVPAWQSKMAIEYSSGDSEGPVKPRIVPDILKRESSIAHIRQPKEICLRFRPWHITHDFVAGAIREHGYDTCSALVAAGALFHHSHFATALAVPRQFMGALIRQFEQPWGKTLRSSGGDCQDLARVHRKIRHYPIPSNV